MCMNPQIVMGLLQGNKNILAPEVKGICGGDFNIKPNDKLDSSQPRTRQTRTNKEIKAASRDERALAVHVRRGMLPSGLFTQHLLLR